MSNRWRGLKDHFNGCQWMNVTNFVSRITQYYVSFNAGCFIYNNGKIPLILYIFPCLCGQLLDG